LGQIDNNVSHKTKSKIMNLIRSILLVISLMVTVASSQAAAVCNANITATTPSSDFVVHGDGTVTHSRTGLMWQRCALGQTRSGSTCTGTASTVSWSGALTAARRSPTAGYTDWRLPNVKELQSIVEDRCYGPSVNEGIFPSTDASDFWSSSSPSYSSSALSISFIDGSTSYNNKSFAVRVRLVRAGQSFGSYDFFSAPGAPTGVSAVAGNTSATVSFTAPASDGGASITGYTATCGDISSATGTASPITVTGLFNGAGYSCTVRATNANGTGAVSVPSNEVIPASADQVIVFGAVPTLVVGSTGTISATGGASGNAVTFTSTTPVVCTLDGNAVTALTVGKCVIAANQVGNAGYSAATQVTQTIAVGAAVPGAPTGIKAVAGNGSMAISFSAASSGGSAITSYLATCNPGSVSKIGTTSPILVGGLTNGTPYTCTVSATNGVGTGPNSDPVNVTPAGQGKAALSTTAVSFGIWGVGVTSEPPQTVTLSNTGNSLLTLPSISTSGDFSRQTTCGTTLAVGAKCIILLSFTPSVSGLRSGTLNVTTSASTTPLTVSLTGTGAATLPKLSSLTVEGATLSPAFGTDTTGYGATLSNAAATVRVTASVADSTATLRVNNVALANGATSAPITLNLGANTLTVRVTAADGETSNDYTIAITRLAPVLTGGSYHSVAIKQDGSLWGWGSNAFGQLGDGTTTDNSVPKSIGSGYTTVAAGDLHTVALQTDGSLWAWGDNTYGQLGLGTTTPSNVPKPVDSGYMAIAVGQFHTLGIKTDGSLWAWGKNDHGQLGDSTVTTQKLPKRVGMGYRAVAAGSGHTLALTDNGSLFAWGQNTYGQLGDATTEDSYDPKLIGTNFKAISAAGHHSIGLKTDGSLWAWGHNLNHQLGDGTATDRSRPTLIGTGFSAIAAGFQHNVALKPDGSLWVWGANDAGQLGDGTTTHSPTPKHIDVESVFSTISAGRGYTVAIKSEGSVWAWGANEFGQLGDGTLARRQTAALVVNDSVSGPLDMDPAQAKNIPENKLPSFWLQVSRSDTVSTALTYNSEDIDQNGAVYVVAYLDSASPLLAASPAQSLDKRAARMTPQSGSGTQVKAVLTRNGWKQSTPGVATESYYSGTLNSSSKNITMFDASKFDPTKDKGIICVIYVGTSVKSAKGLMRSVVSGTDATLNTCPPVDLGNTSDTTVPSAPPSITATATGPGQVNLAWTAANDDVGVVQYNVYRDGNPIATLGNVTIYNDTSPKASTHYSYSVVACDAAQNCSSPSTPIETTTPTQTSVMIEKGWNLVGNGGNTPMDVPALFGDASKVVSLWKWVKSGNTPNINYPGWAFYTPLEADGGASIATGKGYDTLSVIQSGEGFWVRANEAFSVPMTAPVWILSDVFAPGQSNALTGGWNLIATGEAHTPRAFKETVGSFKTLWAWDSGTNGWYFYSPALEASGGLAGYLGKNGYLDFGGLTFLPTTGFWVNMP
jgi:alpha-tubulin suppressor-like RCC1 family protein